MNARVLFRPATLGARLARAGVGLVLAAPVLLVAAAPRSDIVPPQRRQISVETGERLAGRKPPEPLPAELPSPFNPADFDKPDPSEARPGGAPAAGGPRPAGPAAAPAAPVVSGDREILEMLAAQIRPSGTILRAGRARLIINGKLFETGTRFTVTYKDQDYELELVSIQGNNFTLRYRNEETIRPITPR